MINGHGSINFNGLTDKEFIMALQVKEKHEGSLAFPNQQLQEQVTTVNGKNSKYYATIRFDWTGNDGLKAIYQIIEGILEEKKHEHTA
jgi:hypothetical protein